MKLSNQIGKWKFPKDKFVYEKQVLIKQTNMLGNTYFSNYIEWHGEARERFFLEHPSALEYLKENAHIAMVTYCIYHRFIENMYFGDRVRIELQSREIQKHSLVLVFRYYRSGTDQLIGEGWQKVCFSNTETNQLSPVPQIFLDLVESVVEKNLIHCFPPS
ncbi:MAG: hypothetical protein A3C35_02835 [Omnitrophica bacterium RIFCSPHIGHO2_02_FULL_46_11]|nr:MAG: hypothetical protein A3C35_02835 [Omnitrophica bacterium RIFCSPHIGHO2_02_FULL_46_11]